MTTIYGKYEATLSKVLDRLVAEIQEAGQVYKAQTGYKLYEHLNFRIKTEESMKDKCVRKNLPISTQSALKDIKDAIGIRLVCGFVDDIYALVKTIKGMEGVSLYEEKDYIYQAKPNGYRSYHMIIEVETEEADCVNQQPGKYFAEIQLRTIAMDSWASLEHQMKYKKHIANAARIEKELKRCADELASCDLSMQTLRQLIDQGGH